MAITQITTDFAGEIGVNPRLVRIISTDTFATVTTAGYLNPTVLEGYPIYATDFIFMVYNNGAAFSIFTPTISGTGVITLNDTAGSGEVLLPVVSGDFAVFNGTTGQIKDAGFLPSNAAKTRVVMASGATTISDIPTYQDIHGTIGDDTNTGTNFATYHGFIAAGSSAGGDSGFFQLFSGAGGTHSYAILSSDNTTHDSNLHFNVTGQATIFELQDPGAADVNIITGPLTWTSGHLVSATIAGSVADSGIVAGNILQSSITTPDVNANEIRFDITVGFAALATAGKVNLIVSSGSKQYKITNLWMNRGGTNFSGGGGDRLLAISDGTTVYSVIPATNLQALINAGWGISTPLPYPASAAINTSTVAGANLFCQYSGGTTDYTAGSVVISGMAVRVA